jgi:hypothetical protein
VDIAQYVSIFSASISFIGLALVVVQLRANTRQRETESVVKIYDINRQLITLGFSHPQLFDVLDGKPADPVWERCYLQLWLNHLSLIHAFLRRSVLEAELKEWLETEVAGFIAQPNMQQHWQQKRCYYPASFQLFVDGLVNVKADAREERPLGKHSFKRS